ncbi:MAG: hypothetical protein P9M07_03710 [Candidatus Aceula meridiana]|nr:hypothetical protein [Candidatus Aceula meridiana]
MKKLKKIFNWQVWLGISLVALSALVYFIHYLIFHDAHHIFIYLIGDIAFVFLEVLLVTIVLNRLLTLKEKRSLLNKMNMLIGTFFAEVGTDLLDLFVKFDNTKEYAGQELVITTKWTKKDFVHAQKYIETRKVDIDISKGDLKAVKTLLLSKRLCLVNFLANPNLLEHESFTNLLWSVFHLMDELSRRDDLSLSQGADVRHLAGDLNRVYGHLVIQWLNYMRHLKGSYPYLFSLAMRANPFDVNTCIRVT